MKDEHAQFSGSIPAAYDRYLGPMLFQPHAEAAAANAAATESLHGSDPIDRDKPGDIVTEIFVS
jgi:hypothetical protein